MSRSRPIPVGDVPRRYFGKYRGKVLDNYDPLFMGRIMPDVPSAPGMILNWALPATPYAGAGVGFFAIPPIGADVWIEFEGGDPNYPIWSGCFWAEPLDLPLEPAIPLRKCFRTDNITLLADDTPGEGGLYITVKPPVAPGEVTLNFDVEGVTLTVPPNVITVTPETITVEAPPATVTMTAETIEVEIPATTITITGEGIVIETEEVEITANVSIVGAVEIEGDVEITGAVEITGNVEIAGAVEIEGNVEIAGAVEIEGNVEIAGAVEVEGNVNFVGAFEVEGDVNVLGAQQVEGNLAVLGVIEGIVVPPFL